MPLRFYRGLRFLIVEDNQINQKVLSEMLRASGASLHIAENGSEAVISVRKFFYNAALMDIEMPVMNGYEAARRIRQWEATCQQPRQARTFLPIIAMTASIQAEDRQCCLKAGMNDFVGKPVESKDLFTVLNKWVGNSPSTEPIRCQQNGRKKLPDTLPGFDIRMARARFAGNDDNILKLIHSFFYNHRHDADAIISLSSEQLLASRDRQKLLRQIHTIKGMAANLSALNLHDAAQKLEAAVRRPNTATIDCELDRFKKDWEITLASARALAVLRQPLHRKHDK
jgi:CheY-like chemotaxis protein